MSAAENGMPVLSLLIFLPWFGALLLALMPGVSAKIGRGIALIFSFSTLALSAVILAAFDPKNVGYQFVEQSEWIRALNVHYLLGLDGFSLLLVLLTGVITPAALLTSWRETRNPRVFGALFLVLQGATLGVFLALDFFHWFLFWELSLVPAFFLIKLWGGSGASRAAYQFVIYTIGGSAFLLLGFAAIFVATGTLDFPTLTQLGLDGSLGDKLMALGGIWPKAVFVGVFVGFAVKVPLFPFHTWLPDTYAEAPTSVSMFLTAVMSKMGVYGFLRILWPLFPAELHAAAPTLLWLALAGVVLGAFAAMRQTDLKRIIAYSSINHVSYCLLALFAVSLAQGGSTSNPAAPTAAITGAMLQVFNHGLSSAALFCCVAVLESRSAGSRLLGDFGGIRLIAPVFAGLCGIAMFSSIGLPGLNGFVGEFLIFRGVWGLAPWVAAAACLGLFATAWFFLTFWQRVFHGPAATVKPGAMAFQDVRGVEIVTLLPLTLLMLVFGVLPQLLVGFINPLVTSWTNSLPLP